MIEPTGEGFHVTRVGQALNVSEDITVIEKDGKIVYRSSGGRLAYEVVFTVEKETADSTKISQELYLSESAEVHLPIKLLSPITKHAFSVKLDKLAAAIENAQN